eukprot:TRINITY_DN55618_c0_g1_i1.p1 TRINITY_DN55618_c0_g1~~TRINITY_DN55618_c0_g1_i1.p1  ORF type:complete len:490 (-),score=13.10 TRINITY_DN55618_c0_g1_i1:72-1541(-)
MKTLYLVTPTIIVIYMLWHSLVPTRQRRGGQASGRCGGFECCTLSKQVFFQRPMFFTKSGHLEPYLVPTLQANGWQLLEFPRQRCWPISISELSRRLETFQNQDIEIHTLAFFWWGMGSVQPRCEANNGTSWNWDRWDKVNKRGNMMIDAVDFGDPDSWNKREVVQTLLEWGDKTGRAEIVRRWVPVQYALPKDCQKLQKDVKQHQETSNTQQYWIKKPVEGSIHHGKGVQFLSNKNLTAPSWKCSNEKGTVIQEYIIPLLAEERKLDYRAYVAVVNTAPWIVLGYQGLARRSMKKFSMETYDHLVHVPNMGQQDTDPNIPTDELVWNGQTLCSYLVKQQRFPNVHKCHLHLTNHTSRIMLATLDALKSQFTRHRGTFQILAFDFILRETDITPVFLESNFVPGLWRIRWNEPSRVHVGEQFYEAAFAALGGQSAPFRGQRFLDIPLDATRSKDVLGEFGWEVLYDERWGLPPFYWDPVTDTPPTPPEC